MDGCRYLCCIICVCVDIYIYIQLSLSRYTYMYTCAYTYIYMQRYTRTCIGIFGRMWAYTSVDRVDMDAYENMCVYVYMRTHIYIYI